MGRFGGLRLLPSAVLALALLAAFAGVRAQQPARVGLVVLHGDGSVVTRCVEFAEPEISGHDLLLRSGLDLHSEASSMGQTVCRIDQEGCTTPQEPCFCGMQDGVPVYWGYWQRVDSGWIYSPLGASNSRVRPGTVEGWVWGTGATDDAAPLQTYDFDRVCAAPTPTETLMATALPSATVAMVEAATATMAPTVTPTFTALPTATFTPLPQATFTPSPTDTPDATATATNLPTATATASSTPTATPSPTLSPTPLPPLIARFEAEPSVIHAGESVQLQWEARRVYTVTLAVLDAGGEVRSAAVSATDALWLVPTQSTVYRLTAWQGAQSVSAQVEVVVQAAPTATVTPTVTDLPPTSSPQPTAVILPSATPTPVAPLMTQPAPSAPEETRSDLFEVGWLLLLVAPLVVMGLALSGLALIVLLTWLLSDQYL